MHFSGSNEQVIAYMPHVALSSTEVSVGVEIMVSPSLSPYTTFYAFGGGMVFSVPSGSKVLCASLMSCRLIR